jgi:DNA-binding SARP family transcriptional activator
VRFRILGPLEVNDRDGKPVFLHAPKQRALLFVLLLHANRAVSPGHLEAVLWPERPPRSAAGVVRTYVSRLRGVLGLDDPDGPERLPRLSREPGGYRLLLAPGDLDLAVFDDLTVRGRDALDRGDTAQAARMLSGALALWRGEPGADVALEGDSAAILAGLAERRLTAQEAWADAQLALGSDTHLIGQLRTLVAEQPLRERTRGQLMLALYRAGRKAEAVEEFRALRRRMAGDLGIEPSRPVTELHRRILAGELAPGPRAAIPRQLPRDTRGFTGREAQLTAMKALLPTTGLPVTGVAAPVVTVITGTAGVGKTALAVHFAHLTADRFPDGQLFADLRGHADAEPVRSAEALHRFLRALEAREIPGDTDEAAARYRSLLAGKRMIILLDNAADASQVRPLLPGSAGCLVLVTSRSRLPGLLARNGATPVTVEPMTEAEGVTLLRKVLGASRVDADPDSAATIVARCARLPLALRITAERAAHRPRLDLATLAAELAAEHRRLDVLTVGEDRHATVRSVFSRSYARLTPDAARMFRLLGLHPGSDIGVRAAAALAGGTLTGTARLLEALADVHLLQETAPRRYRFHDLLRAYAAERAVAEVPAAARRAGLRRVLGWYLHTADAVGRVLMPARRRVPLEPPPAGCQPLVPADYPSAKAWCDTEHANLIAAIGAAADHGENEIAWQIHVVMGSYFELGKPGADWIAAGRLGVEAARRAGNRLGEAWALSVLGDLLRADRAVAQAGECWQRALAILTNLGHPLAREVRGRLEALKALED